MSVKRQSTDLSANLSLVLSNIEMNWFFDFFIAYFLFYYTCMYWSFRHLRCLSLSFKLRSADIFLEVFSFCKFKLNPFRDFYFFSFRDWIFAYWKSASPFYFNRLSLSHYCIITLYFLFNLKIMRKVSLQLLMLPHWYLNLNLRYLCLYDQIPI